jgi:hypothetical protein
LWDHATRRKKWKARSQDLLSHVGGHFAALFDLLAADVGLPSALPDRRNRARPAFGVGQRMEKVYLGDAPSATAPLFLAGVDHPGGLFCANAVDVIARR